jgi:hypothetical protein
VDRVEQGGRRVVDGGHLVVHRKKNGEGVLQYILISLGDRRTDRERAYNAVHLLPMLGGREEEEEAITLHITSWSGENTNNSKYQKL